MLLCFLIICCVLGGVLLLHFLIIWSFFCFFAFSAVVFSDYLLCFFVVFSDCSVFCFFPAVFLILLFLYFCFVNVFFVLPDHSVNLICCVYTLNLLISQNIIRSRGEETTGQRRL